MSQWTKKKGKKSTPFKPSHDYINSAVEEFLENGGEIHTITVDDNNLLQFVGRNELSLTVDEFLLGQ